MNTNSWNTKGAAELLPGDLVADLTVESVELGWRALYGDTVEVTFTNGSAEWYRRYDLVAVTS